MGNQTIMTKGYRFVGGTYNKPVEEIASGERGVIDIGKYAWESAGWFWCHGSGNYGDLNKYADAKNATSVSKAINPSEEDEKRVQRAAYIKEFYKILTGYDITLT